MSSKIELVQTLDECQMGDFVPDDTDEGLREILVACLEKSPGEIQNSREKRNEGAPAVFALFPCLLSLIILHFQKSGYRPRFS